MKKKVVTMLIACMCMLLMACEKEPSDSENMNDILAGQDNIEVTLGEAYHQEKVLFDTANDKAVIPENASWGRHGFRDREVAGIFYGSEEGGEIYETDIETTPELYMDSYFASIQNLELKAEDIKQGNYVIKIAKISELKPFAEELVRLSNIVMKNKYKLTGVEIEFDKQCRPVKKIFQLQNVDENGWDKENESEECTQEFSYDTGKMKFENAFEKVKKEIEEE